MVAELVLWTTITSMASSLGLREKEKLAKFRGRIQSFRQWMLSIERQIGSEDPRLWMLIHRTIELHSADSIESHRRLCQEHER